MIERVFLEGKEIILVGTAHVSSESVKLVEQVINDEKPEVVGVELDDQRFAQLKQGEQWKEQNVMDLLNKGQAYLFLLNLMLANMQRKIGEDLGVRPGSEMLKAIELAEAQNARIALLDRNVKVTLKRAFNKTSLKEKLKLGGGIVMGLFAGGEAIQITKEKVEEMKQKDIMTELIKELSKEAPSIKEVLVDERDFYIAQKILACDCKKIVAVVGAGHVDGIKENLSKGKQSVAELEKIPEKRNWIFEIIKYGIPALFIAFLAWGFYTKGWAGSLEVFAYWFLITGVLSAAGALIARAHPLSALIAFVAAPFTTLHPALASGWFAAIAEAKFRKPKVKDFETLNKLDSYKDFQKNNVTHLLIVASFTNIGSTIGVIIALPYLTKLLF
ncbi:MAG: TraB/GumN family protein [Candidatus Diapherotrites archaeon]|nr:TraB/GumN family protein [Candidatus Diapherotrites archaeon]